MVTVEQPNLSLPKGICQPGSTRLQAYLMNKFTLGNSGCYNPNSTLSGGGPSFHVSGQAIDLTCNFNDLAQRDRGDACFNWLYEQREELNLQQIIFGHRIWSSFDQVIKTYNPNDHLNHLHCSLSSNAAVNWTVDWIIGDEDLTKEEHDIIIENNLLLKDLHTFMGESRNSDTLQPFVAEVWRNYFQGKGSSILTGEFRNYWKKINEKLGIT